MELTLLGTGTPIADVRRRGSSQLIEVGNDAILVDTGAGTLHRLVEARYATPRGGPRRPLRWIALTHLHSDHITGLADVLWAGWVGRWWQRAPRLVGPPGTAEFIADLMRAFKYDIAIRTAGE